MTEFEKLVKKMREKQKLYFGSPYGSQEKKHAMIEAMDLEKQVDAYLKEKETKQEKLF